MLCTKREHYGVWDDLGLPTGWPRRVISGVLITAKDLMDAAPTQSEHFLQFADACAGPTQLLALLVSLLEQGCASGLVNPQGVNNLFGLSHKGCLALSALTSPHAYEYTADRKHPQQCTLMPTVMYADRMELEPALGRAVALSPIRFRVAT